VSENKQWRNLHAIVFGQKRNGGGSVLFGTDTPTLIYYAAYLRQWAEWANIMPTATKKRI